MKHLRQTFVILTAFACLAQAQNASGNVTPDPPVNQVKVMAELVGNYAKMDEALKNKDLKAYMAFHEFYFNTAALDGTKLTRPYVEALTDKVLRDTNTTPAASGHVVNRVSVDWPAAQVHVFALKPYILAAAQQKGRPAVKGPTDFSLVYSRDVWLRTDQGWKLIHTEQLSEGPSLLPPPAAP